MRLPYCCWCKSLLSLVCLVGSFFALQAQNEDTQSLDDLQINWQVHNSLIHWMDPFIPSAHFAVSRNINRRSAFRGEFGLLFKGDSNRLISPIGGSGFRTRFGFRRYRQPPLFGMQAAFWEVSLGYRYYDATIAKDVRRANGAYIQQLIYNMWQNNLSLNFLVGSSRPMGKHLRFEYGIGLGLKYRHRAYSDLPDDADQNFFSSSLWDHGNKAGSSLTVAMPVIFSIGYCW